MEERHCGASAALCSSPETDSVRGPESQEVGPVGTVGHGRVTHGTHGMSFPFTSRGHGFHVKKIRSHVKIFRSLR